MKGKKVRITYKTTNSTRTFNGLAMFAAKKQHAYNGLYGVTIQQHYYSRHDMHLSHAHLPCVILYGPSGRKDYFPLELVRLVTNDDQGEEEEEEEERVGGGGIGKTQNYRSKKTESANKEEESFKTIPPLSAFAPHAFEFVNSNIWRYDVGSTDDEKSKQLQKQKETPQRVLQIQERHLHPGIPPQDHIGDNCSKKEHKFASSCCRYDTHSSPHQQQQAYRQEPIGSEKKKKTNMRNGETKMPKSEEEGGGGGNCCVQDPSPSNLVSGFHFLGLKDWDTSTDAYSTLF
jgi:hypothetical protein